MKSFLSGIIGLLLATLTAQAQSDEVGKDEVVQNFTKESHKKGVQIEGDSAQWQVGGNFGINFNQAAYRHWQAGGVNSVASNSLINLFANYSDGKKWDWDNALTIAYGLALQDTVLNKTDDRIELNSRVDRLLSKKWSASGFLNFRTQFTAGFEEPGQREDSLRISNFMAPGYLINGVGFTYKPDKKFTAVFSPATSKMTFVLDEDLAARGAFGVDPGSNSRFEIGGYLNLIYNTPLGKNISLQSRLDIYANYVQVDYPFPDYNAEVILFMKVNEYINANITFQSIYDFDAKFDLDNDPDTPGVDRVQLKEVLAIGFSYNFGAKQG